jgi:CRP/FNR family cyclic AMP-dependent transcriptional regulator
LAAVVKKLKNVKAHVFDAQAFLDSAGVARKVKEFKKAVLVYSQGDAADSVMYLQEGSVKLTVISEGGK